MPNTIISLRKTVVMTALASCGVTYSSVDAATRRDLRNSPELATNLDVGPTIDSDGSNGQYFRRGSLTELRTHEFYDDSYDNDASFIPVRIKDLWGQVIDINKVNVAGVDHITDFKLRVSVFNQFDPGGQPFQGFGVSQLGERNSRTAYQRSETMLDTLVTMEFARLPGSRPAQIDAGTDERFYNEFEVNNTEGISSGPTAPHIIALESDATAWYGITPGSPRSTVYGDYLVPTYDFGTLLPDQTVSRDIEFVVEGNGIPDGEQRFEALEASWLYWRYFLPPSDPDYIAPPDPITAALQKNFADVLYGHSTDLKVGNYLDTMQTHLVQRNGFTGFEGTLPIGNASVFYNVPEPASLTAIVAASWLVAKRRHRAR
jgi:hypothetical protein